MTNKFDDFTYKLTRLMPNNKMVPSGALWLSVKTESGVKSGMLVKIGCKPSEYLNCAKMVRIHIEKQLKRNNFASKDLPELIKEIESEQKQFMKPWRRFLRFLKRLFTKRKSNYDN